MISLNFEGRIEPIEVLIEVEIDVANYSEVVKENAGSLAGIFSRFGVVRKRVDAEIRQQTLGTLNGTLNARLRREVLAGIEDGGRQGIDEELNRQLTKNGVEADVKVSVNAR